MEEDEEDELDELFGVEETPAGVEEGLELDAKIDENRLRKELMEAARTQKSLQ